MKHVLLNAAVAVACAVCAQEKPATNQTVEANAPETTQKEISSGFFAEANADVYSAYVWRGIVSTIILFFSQKALSGGRTMRSEPSRSACGAR